MEKNINIIIIENLKNTSYGKFGERKSYNQLLEENKKLNDKLKEKIYFECKQFISLNRFNDLRYDQNQEIKNFNEEIERLTKENTALKILLKQTLNKEDD